MIISRTPYRLSFFGGGTDYPEWVANHGGSVLASAINKYCYITCRCLPPFFEHRSRIVYSKIECVEYAADVRHPAVRACLEFLNESRGVEIHHDGDLPARSGIGSSSTFTVGLLHALHALHGRMTSREQLAREAIHVEQSIIGETVGAQDQVTTAFGGLNRIAFLKSGEFTVAPVILNEQRRKLLSDRLLLFFTGVSRTASDVAEGYVNAIMSKADRLHRMQSLVGPATEILTGDGDINEFGALLHESWMIKRSLSERVSTPLIDDLYRRAREAGAIGGKLSGAGAGGFFLIFAEPEQHDRIRSALHDCLHVPFDLEPHGSQIIYYSDETDYLT